MTSDSLTFDELFDPEFLQELQHFSLRMAQVQKGGRLADQKTKARGTGLEFADFKPYVAGDDLRAIDWNIYRRLGRVFVRIFEEQQDMPVYLLQDVSSSMFFDNGLKVKAALRSALGLSAITLHQHDSVGLFPFADDLEIRFKSTSGRDGVMRVARHLANLEEHRRTDFLTTLKHFSGVSLRRGLLVIVSDFFDEAGIDEIINSMKHLRHRLLLVQITQPSDADPSLNEDVYGDIRLQDCESDDTVEVTITPQILSRYKEIYEEFNDKLTGFAKDYKAGFVQIDATKDVLQQLSKLFETGGMLL